MTLQVFGIILSAVLGFSATITSTLVLYRLSSIDKRIDRHDEQLGALNAEAKRLAERKIECQTEFIDVGQFLKETGYTRKRLDDVIELVKEISGRLDVIAQLPQICGQIASQTVKELMSYIGTFKKG